MGLGFILGVAVTLAVIVVCSFFEHWQVNHEHREEPTVGPVGGSGASDAQDTGQVER